ncbi:putative isoflavone 2'-hydroxylase [Helianthus annuus]|uniref:Isoflavone 2'-hydroxylase n=1 Tax=Helianthus annuus TaxID=4232 RepID=A0A251VSF2_HELAN|nr:cytochrome P450 81Q32 [Helianthus annuus]XP_021985790.1 cytochrome P450 81Q32 [Helianthus annuus]XP_035846617.1 cytochrome P450 81Q32 [Helianthus annuus]XP_035846618.1 cytochrome P450 81Q32 [Helianthus annuus]KAF5806512.1 putative isoflavone 2'-hydroxylase [Helianthus annuus]KAJ0570775.1 putative isoflavone 2'-hydroxylase [Helianthus annuus]KAJ0577719.1 putative isoflavone 2'-hydroxylase [Helianthus annuus]KAJ0585116.1 putative isoflavone 2'-hydroxylase [Helianthus annuus]KAJ0747667.1 pu
MGVELNLWITLPLLTAIYILTKHILHKLNHLPPTPFPTLPLIGHLHLLKKPLHRSLAKLSQTHRQPALFLRFGSRNVLHVASPTAAEECLSKNDVVFANRPHLLSGKYFGYNYTSLPWAPYGDHWQNLRRISAVEILSNTRLDSLADIRLDEIRSMILKFSCNKDNGPDHTVNLRSEFSGFMFNVMTRMMGGKRFYGDLDGGEVEEAKRFGDLLADTEQVISESKILDMLPNFRWLFAGKFEKRYAAVQQRRDDFMQVWIDEFRAGGLCGGEEKKKKKKTLLEILLSLQDADPEYYTDEMIKSLSQALLHGGINTSVETMEWAMTLLLNNPHVLHKAQTEIDSFVGCDRLVNEADLSKLPYLQCIIKETLRMHPTAPLLLPHESSKDCVVGGYHIPHGTMLFVNVWAIQNDPNTWESPDMFIPERFEGKESSIKVKDGLTMMPFGSGRRRCPGENLALRIVGLALASIIQCFDWKRVGVEMVDMSEAGGFTAPKAEPLVAKYQRRSIVEHLLSQI